MALPLAFSLNRLQRAALPIIRGGVAKGLSSRIINTIIGSALGSGINRNLLLKIIRAEKGIKATTPKLKFLRLTDFPNANTLPESITRQARKFRFIVEVRGTLIDTGESIVQNITVSTDTVLTRGEIESIAENFVVEGDERYGIDVNNVVLITGEQAGKAGLI